MEIYYNNVPNLIVKFTESVKADDLKEGNCITFSTIGVHTFGFFYKYDVYSFNCKSDDVFIYTGRRLYVQESVLKKLPPPPSYSITRYFKKRKRSIDDESDQEYVMKIKKYFCIEDELHSVKVTCPFHNDKNPSLSISFEKNIYHCFGCKESGTLKKLSIQLSTATNHRLPAV